jgi:trimethylamine:corrinoid methyltransferase-like protein
MKLEGDLPRLQILNNTDIQKIYFAALEVLERTGVAVKNEEACDLLKEAGAYMDGETARIPSSLIEKNRESGSQANHSVFPDRRTGHTSLRWEFIFRLGGEYHFPGR